MPTFQRGHTTIAYTDTGAPAGREDAPVVFFAHGLLFSGWMFRHQIAHLRGRYRCVTIDFRGQGESPRAIGGYDMDTLTVDVSELLRHLQIPVVNFVGLSMGGFVGMRLAARNPEVVHSLTLLDTAATAEEPANRSRYKTLAKVYRLAGIKPLRSRVAPIMLAGRNQSAPWVDDWMTMLDRTDRVGLVTAIESVADRDPCEDEAIRIIAPTLVMVGAEDAATPPEKSRRIVDLIADTSFHEIPGAGHSPTMEQPDEVNTILEAFLSEYNA
ncbi:alpha/beta fold hydrolase [Dietzia sp. PP-33]|jgi:3-oxoadipate enol-lactonase|uniref:alpha/beta fold hydrolase n=1 Tax=Dietzia sp. PP-33 TaxID=2957500 RepID=UPI0029B82B2B|nr:alpha/beta fold hydrolase [Dietzia sp. PP-33]MDX2356394.1 alpha/beta hydrolase [Dietzia sp. PP-33]